MEKSDDYFRNCDHWKSWDTNLHILRNNIYESRFIWCHRGVNYSHVLDCFTANHFICIFKITFNQIICNNKSFQNVYWHVKPGNGEWDYNTVNKLMYFLNRRMRGKLYFLLEANFDFCRCKEHSFTFLKRPVIEKLVFKFQSYDAWSKLTSKIFKTSFFCIRIFFRPNNILWCDLIRTILSFSGY